MPQQALPPGQMPPGAQGPLQQMQHQQGNTAIMGGPSQQQQQQPFQQMGNHTALQSDPMAQMKQQQQLQQQASFDGQMGLNALTGNMSMMPQEMNLAEQQGLMSGNVSNAILYGNKMNNQTIQGMGPNLSNVSQLNQSAPMNQSIPNSMNAMPNWSLQQQQPGQPQPQQQQDLMKAGNQRQNIPMQQQQQQHPGQMPANQSNQFGFNQQQQQQHQPQLQPKLPQLQHQPQGPQQQQQQHQQPRMQPDQHGQYPSGVYDPMNRSVPENRSLGSSNESSLYNSPLQTLEHDSNDSFSMPRSMPLYNMSTQFCSLSSSLPSSMAFQQSQASAFATTTTSSSHTGNLSQQHQHQQHQQQLGRLPNVPNSQGHQQQNSLTVNSQSNRQPVHPSQQSLTNKHLQQFSENAWAHATELSPILDVSPSVEAAEAQEILERRSRSLVC